MWTDIVFQFVADLSNDEKPACGFDTTVPRIYALEPGPGNVNLLNQLKKKLPKKVQKSLFIEQLAMSNRTGTACMAGSTAPGTELASLSGPAGNQGACKAGEWSVKTYSVTEWLNHHRVKHVTYLKIDVEGFDSQVILGAEGAMRAGIIDMLSFEYHKLGLWPQTSLEEMVKIFDSVGYDSYFIGDYQLYKLGGGCWHSSYEIRTWSNVLAVRRGYEKHNALLRAYHKTSCENQFMEFTCDRFKVEQRFVNPVWP